MPNIKQRRREKEKRLKDKTAPHDRCKQIGRWCLRVIKVIFQSVEVTWEKLWKDRKKLRVRETKGRHREIDKKKEKSSLIFQIK